MLGIPAFFKRLNSCKKFKFGLNKWNFGPRLQHQNIHLLKHTYMSGNKIPFSRWNRLLINTFDRSSPMNRKRSYKLWKKEDYSHFLSQQTGCWITWTWAKTEHKNTLHICFHGQRKEEIWADREIPKTSSSTPSYVQYIIFICNF